MDATAKRVRVLMAAQSGAQAYQNRIVDGIDREIQIAQNAVGRSRGDAEDPAFQDWLLEQEREKLEWDEALKAVLGMLQCSREDAPG